MKTIGDKFLVLGTNESFYSYNNDITLIKSSLILDVRNFELRLNFTKFHISDKEEQTKTHLPSYNVGTFFKVKKRLISNLLKDHAQKKRPFDNKGWKTDYSDHCSITELFNDLKTKDYLIMRSIKLLKIRKLLKKKK